MKKGIFLSLSALLAANKVAGDIYANGSNNRLNEATATRTNNNRLFDSQNNARGGRNCGDRNAAAFDQGETHLDDLASVYDVTNTNSGQYAMSFIEGSEVFLSWTAQHGCGGNDVNDPYNINCNFVIQYMCDTSKRSESDPLYVSLTNGSNTNTPTTSASVASADVTAARTTNANDKTGRHESEAYYAACNNRKRNTGLFNADQNLQGDTSIYTRQNAAGTRYGLECPTEQAYYPVWFPTPWIDIAYLTTAYYNENFDICQYISDNTMNTNKKYRCDEATSATKAAEITSEECSTAGGTWTGYTHNLSAPECKPADWSLDNHLGAGRSGQFNNYTWTLPTLAALKASGSGITSTTSGSNEWTKCVHRIRYNITTDDYDPWNTYASSNNIITNNPTIDLGADLQGLQLNINTAQFGRTFQDRSHVFTIRNRASAFGSNRIVNLNVVGKRGNIVQTHPDVEYYFSPSIIRASTSDFIHIQWDGSNTHQNGAPGGDGQTGDDGQGANDRNNFVLNFAEGENWPIPLDLAKDHMFKYVTCYNPDGSQIKSTDTENPWLDCAIILASGGYYRSLAQTTTKDALDANMNNGYASFIGGVVIRISKPGTYYYMSSRNNNFTNRSQKGIIHIE